jgi:hypothetical protein
LRDRASRWQRERDLNAQEPLAKSFDGSRKGLSDRAEHRGVHWRYRQGHRRDGPEIQASDLPDRCQGILSVGPRHPLGGPLARSRRTASVPAFDRSIPWGYPRADPRGNLAASLVAMAMGSGHRPIAADLGSAPSTVWEFCVGAQPWSVESATTACVGPMPPTRDTSICRLAVRPFPTAGVLIEVSRFVRGQIVPVALPTRCRWAGTHRGSRSRRLEQTAAAVLEYLRGVRVRRRLRQ